MFCIHCGSTIAPDVHFCRSCGRRQNLPIGSSPSNGGSSAKSVLTPTAWFVIALLLIIVVGAILSVDTSPPSRSSVTVSGSGKTVSNGEQAQPVVHQTEDATKPKRVRVRLNVPQISLRHKGEVEKLLGMPLRVKHNSGWQSAEYSWGDIQYERDVVTGLTYRYSQPRPNNYTEALAALRLQPTSEPLVRETGNYQWSEIMSAPLRCCGFEFDSVMLEGDFSSIDISVKRRIGKWEGKSFGELSDTEHLAIAMRIVKKDTADVNRAELDEASKHLTAIKSENLRMKADAIQTKIAEIEAAQVSRGVWDPR